MLQRTSRQDEFGLCLELHFPPGEAAEIVGLAVLPEAKARHLKRSSVSLGIKKGIISINIRSQDTVAMRASLNGCLNSIILAESILEV
jgi:tRNA threonylcarbamoyladenosine modification (KEOPS) complex  Pcc1 subunit